MKIHNINLLFNHLVKDEKSDIQMLKLTNGMTSLLIAELKSKKKLPAHYHNEGTEIYQILSGEGKIEIGELSCETVIWNQSFTIKAGDVFEVMPKVVHRLSNDSGEVLRMIFFAPPSHLCDEDRIFI
mgnify:CR=1 FL=1